MNLLKDIKHAICGLKPQALTERFARLAWHPPVILPLPGTTVFEQGLGLFGSPEDAKLLDEVVGLAYEEHRRLDRSAPMP
ncbi:MAG: hypothetical protein NTW74_13440 [Acidobacteria bacterium]|nr:hypothetical protein [Acidobacteriota bacterium]